MFRYKDESTLYFRVAFRLGHSHAISTQPKNVGSTRESFLVDFAYHDKQFFNNIAYPGRQFLCIFVYYSKQLWKH